MYRKAIRKQLSAPLLDDYDDEVPSVPLTTSTSTAALTDASLTVATLERMLSASTGTNGALLGPLAVNASLFSFVLWRGLRAQDALNLACSSRAMAETISPGVWRHFLRLERFEARLIVTSVMTDAEGTLLTTASAAAGAALAAADADITSRSGWAALTGGGVYAAERLDFFRRRSPFRGVTSAACATFCAACNQSYDGVFCCGYAGMPLGVVVIEPPRERVYDEESDEEEEEEEEEPGSETVAEDAKPDENLARLTETHACPLCVARWLRPSALQTSSGGGQRLQRGIALRTSRSLDSIDLAASEATNLWSIGRSLSTRFVAAMDRGTGTVSTAAAARGVPSGAAAGGARPSAFATQFSLPNVTASDFDEGEADAEEDGMIGGSGDLEAGWNGGTGAGAGRFTTSSAEFGVFPHFPPLSSDLSAAAIEAARETTAALVIQERWRHRGQRKYWRVARPYRKQAARTMRRRVVDLVLDQLSRENEANLRQRKKIWSRTVLPIFKFVTSERVLVSGLLLAVCLVEFAYMLGTIRFNSPYFYHGIQDGGVGRSNVLPPPDTSTVNSGATDGAWVLDPKWILESTESPWSGKTGIPGLFKAQTAVAQSVSVQLWTTPLVLLTPLWVFVLVSMGATAWSLYVCCGRHRRGSMRRYLWEQRVSFPQAIIEHIGADARGYSVDLEQAVRFPITFLLIMIVIIGQLPMFLLAYITGLIRVIVIGLATILFLIIVDFGCFLLNIAWHDILRQPTIATPPRAGIQSIRNWLERWITHIHIQLWFRQQPWCICQPGVGSNVQNSAAVSCAVGALLKCCAGCDHSLSHSHVTRPIVHQCLTRLRCNCGCKHVRRCFQGVYRCFTCRRFLTEEGAAFEERRATARRLFPGIALANTLTSKARSQIQRPPTLSLCSAREVATQPGSGAPASVCDACCGGEQGLLCRIDSPLPILTHHAILFIDFSFTHYLSLSHTHTHTRSHDQAQQRPCRESHGATVRDRLATHSDFRCYFHRDLCPPLRRVRLNRAPLSGAHGIGRHQR